MIDFIQNYSAIIFLKLHESFEAMNSSSNSTQLFQKIPYFREYFQ